MKVRLLSSLAKFTISAISVVAVSACVLTLIVKLTERRVKRVNDYSYVAKPVGHSYTTLLEGGYWQLAYVQDTTKAKVTEVKFSEVASVLDLLSDAGASYAYSYKDKMLSSFWPMSDAKRIISTWNLQWYKNYMLLNIVIPFLKSDNSKMMAGQYSDSYAEFCKVMDCALPAMAMTGCRDFEFNEDVPVGETEPVGFPDISNGLKIKDLGENLMVLAKGKYRFHYKRVKDLPHKIAPISIYFQETAYNAR